MLTLWTSVIVCLREVASNLLGFPVEPRSHSFDLSLPFRLRLFVCGLLQHLIGGREAGGRSFQFLPLHPIQGVARGDPGPMHLIGLRMLGVSTLLRFPLDRSAKWLFDHDL